MIEYNVTINNGKTKSYTYITCDRCLKELRSTSDNIKDSIKPLFAIYMVRQRGWKMGKKHLCEGCVKKCKQSK